MRVNSYKNGGYSTRGFTSPGGIMSGPLVLAKNPTKELEASNKLYVDTVLSNFDANNFTSGILPINRLPPFTGDLISNPGSNNVILKETGISSGIYSKITVNAKGLSTSGSGLLESDIPNLSWDKINSDKPDTLVGYGITDAVAVNGGTINGNLTLFSDPLNDMHIATKQYVDISTTSVNSLKLGDIIAKNTPETPVGFLRVNGGVLSKTDYAALFSVIGDVFSIIDKPGGGKPWEQEYYIDSTQSSDINNWTIGTSLPTSLSQSQVIVTKNKVFLIGGYDGTSYLDTVQSATINADGTLGSWTTEAKKLPTTLAASQAIVSNNNVYLFGGFDGTLSVSSVYTAPINTDGTLGDWVTSTTSLPNPLSHSKAIVTKTKIYLFGGKDSLGNVVPVVYSTNINDDGTLTSWTQEIDLPINIHSAQVFFTKSRLYLVGGNAGSPISNVYTTTINLDGSINNWAPVTSLPGPLSSAKAIVTKYRVYLLGGLNSTGFTSNVYTAPINSDGTLGSWSTGTSLPGILGEGSVIITSSKVYLLGGNDGTSITNTVYVSNIIGGLSDYSPYYNGSIKTTDPDKFKLPDLTTYELEGTYPFIKL